MTTRGRRQAPGHGRAVSLILGLFYVGQPLFQLSTKDFGLLVEARILNGHCRRNCK